MAAAYIVRACTFIFLAAIVTLGLYIMALTVPLGVSRFPPIVFAAAADEDGYFVNDTTLELYVTSTVRITPPYTQAVLPSHLLSPAAAPLASIGDFIDSASSSSSSSSTASPCYFDVPLDDEDDFSTATTAAPQEGGSSNGGEGDRHAYYKKHRACQFTEIIGTHNVPFASGGRAAIVTVDTSRPPLSKLRWTSAADTQQPLQPQQQLASVGNRTMVAVVATLVRRTYWASRSPHPSNGIVGYVNTSSQQPLRTYREPARGVFLRLVTLSTAAQQSAALRGTDFEVGLVSPAYATVPSAATAPFVASGTTAAQQTAAAAVSRGIRLLLRRIVSDQTAFDALWGPYDTSVDEAAFEAPSAFAPLRVPPESPAILFDDSAEATAALKAFASHSNFTSLLRIAEEAITTTTSAATSAISTSTVPTTRISTTSETSAATATTAASEEPTSGITSEATASPAPAPAPPPSYRSLLLQREALRLFSAWALISNNDWRGTTGFTDTNGVAEFPQLRGLSCARDVLLWPYVRRRVPSLPPGDAVRGLIGVNRTVVIGDARVTLRPIAKKAFALADDDFDGGTSDAMTWAGALAAAAVDANGNPIIDDFTGTRTVSMRQTVTRTLRVVANPTTGPSVTSATSATTAATTTAPTAAPLVPTPAPPTTWPSDDSGNSGADADAYDPLEEIRRSQRAPRMHAWLRRSAAGISRNITRDIGEVHEAMRFILVDSCGRTVKTAGRLSLEGGGGGGTSSSSSSSSSSSNSDDAVFSHPSLGSVFGGGFIGAVESQSRLVSVAIPTPLFGNMTDRHSPQHAAYARRYFRAEDFSSGVDGSALVVPGVTLHPSIADPFYMYRFTVSEPLWSRVSTNSLLRRTVWAADRPWPASRFGALAAAADEAFGRRPPPLRVWGIAFDCLALAQNVSRQAQATAAFKLSIHSEAAKGLARGHGAPKPLMLATVKYTPETTPMAFSFPSAADGDVPISRQVSDDGWGSTTVPLPQPLPGAFGPLLVAGASSNGNGSAVVPNAVTWAPMLLSPNALFPSAAMAYDEAMGRTSRDPSTVEYLLDAVGARATVAMERWKERRVIAAAGTTVSYTPRPLSWIVAARPAVSGTLFPNVPLDPLLFGATEAAVSCRVGVSYFFTPLADAGAGMSAEAAAKRALITAQKIPIAFSIAYGDEEDMAADGDGSSSQSIAAAAVRFFPPQNDLPVLQQLFPIDSAEEQGASYNSAPAAAVEKALRAQETATSLSGNAPTFGALKGCGDNYIAYGRRYGGATQQHPDSGWSPSPDAPMTLRSRCTLSASEVSRRGLVITWATPLNVLATNIATRRDLMRSVRITAGHTQEAAPRALSWALPSLAAMPLRYSVNIVTRDRGWAARDGGQRHGSAIFLFNQSGIDEEVAADLANATSSAFLTGITFIHSLRLPPTPSYYTHMDEDALVQLLPSLVRSPYSLAQTNFSFRILASDVSAAEKARDWLSLIGMWGRTSSLGTVSSLTTVAGCSNDAGMSLHLALYPLHFAIGEGPARYYVGAIIMNTVTILVFCALVLLSSRVTSRFSDTFPNESIVLTFILYPGTAYAGMGALAWLNTIDPSLRYVVLIIVIVHVIGFPIVFFVLGYRRRPQWEQTKAVEAVDSKGDVLGGMSSRQKMALKKRRKKLRKQQAQEQLRARPNSAAAAAASTANASTASPNGAPKKEVSEVERIMGAITAKLVGRPADGAEGDEDEEGGGGRSQALSILKFFTPEGHYVMVHSDHLRFEATYGIYRGSSVRFVAAEVVYPFLVGCCALLECPDNTYAALGLITAHILFTFLLHPHITLGRNLVAFAADALLLVAVALQLQGNESVSRTVFTAASLTCSCCNAAGLLAAFWCHRWWRATIKKWNKTLKRWALRGPLSRRARIAGRLGPFTAALQAHLDAIYAKRPDVIYRNKRRLALMSQIVHQRIVNAQELDEEVEIDARELIKESAVLEALGMVGRDDSSDSLPEELAEKGEDGEGADAARHQKSRSDRKRAFSSHKKAALAAAAARGNSSDGAFDDGGGGAGGIGQLSTSLDSGAVAGGGGSREGGGGGGSEGRPKAGGAVNRFLAATAARARQLATGGSVANASFSGKKGSAYTSMGGAGGYSATTTSGSVLTAPLLGGDGDEVDVGGFDDDEDTYVSGGAGIGGEGAAPHRCLYNSVEMEEFYSRPENAHNRSFDPFKLRLSFEDEEDDEALAKGPSAILTTDGYALNMANSGFSPVRRGQTGDLGKPLESLVAPSPSRPRLGPAVLPPIGGVHGSFGSLSRADGPSDGPILPPDRRGGGGRAGADGRSSASGASPTLSDYNSPSFPTASNTRDGRSSRAGASSQWARGSQSQSQSNVGLRGLDRLSIGSAGERNAVQEGERLRRAVAEEKRKFDVANEQRLQQYVYGSRREVMMNPHGTLIVPQVPTAAESEAAAMFGSYPNSPAVPPASFYGSNGGHGIGRGGGLGFSGDDRVSGAEGWGPYSNSDASFGRRSAVTSRSRRDTSAGGANSGGGGYASASPNIADKIVNRSHRHRSGGPSSRRAFGQDDDEGTVVHVFMTARGMEESRVSTSAADRTLQLKGPEAVSRLVTAETSRRVRTAFESNVFSPEVVAELEATEAMRRRMRRSNRQERRGRGGGKGAAMDSDEDSGNDELLKRRDIFGRYRKPQK